MRDENRAMVSPVTRRGFLQASAAVSAATVMANLGSNFAFAAGSDKIRVGLIGCGGRGRGAALDCLRAADGVELVALGDLFQDQLDAAKIGFKTRKEAEEDEDPKVNFKAKINIKDDMCFVGWDAYKKVLASDVNYVILASPPAFRPMMIQAAIEAGKNVFGEKPCAVDPAGCRLVMEAGKMAAQKNLGIVAGTQRRHSRSYAEIIKRIHDGAIGKVLAAQVYWTQGGGRQLTPRKPGWSDLEYQLRNWPYYAWLAGDHIVEQHMHQMDVANWIMGTPPKFCIGMGGRQSRVDPAYGNIYDHFAIDYEYPNGARVLSMCRQVDGCYSRIGENIIGSDGTAIPESRILGKNPFKFDGDIENPYMLEHKDLIASIRAGKPLNEGQQIAESSLTSIMGRMSAYTGKLVTWAQAMASKLDMMPKKLDFATPMTPALVPIPGTEPLI